MGSLSWNVMHFFVVSCALNLVGIVFISSQNADSGNSFSNVDFHAANTPADDADIDGQMKLRSTRFWGRIYIDGWPQTIQYFQAHFGTPPPFGKKIFIFAEPQDACESLRMPIVLSDEYVVLAHRGNCTFGSKAKIVADSSASALIIINNEPSGIEHLNAPDAQNINISVISISQKEGLLLENSYYDPSVKSFNGYIVPINCVKGALECVPTTVEEVKLVERINEGGVIVMNSAKSGSKDISIEYLLAKFGTMLPQEMSVVRADPEEACGPLINDVKGKAVLVKRGNCEFLTKAEEVQNAGGKAIIVGSTYPYIVRMAVEPRYKGLDTIIPAIMVTKRGYDALIQEKNLISITFRKQNDVNNTIWESIERLSLGQTKFFDPKLWVEHYKRWPDRKLSLDALKSRFPSISMPQSMISTSDTGSSGSNSVNSIQSEL